MAPEEKLQILKEQNSQLELHTNIIKDFIKKELILLEQLHNKNTSWQLDKELIQSIYYILSNKSYIEVEQFIEQLIDENGGDLLNTVFRPLINLNNPQYVKMMDTHKDKYIEVIGRIFYDQKVQNRLYNKLIQNFNNNTVFENFDYRMMTQENLDKAVNYIVDNNLTKCSRFVEKYLLQFKTATSQKIRDFLDVENAGLSGNN